MSKWVKTFDAILYELFGNKNRISWSPCHQFYGTLRCRIGAKKHKLYLDNPIEKLH